jgi:hypothetical protein
MKRSIFFTIVFIFLVSQLSFAQEPVFKKKNDFWERVSVGGNLGLQFGSITDINISPEIMIRTVDQLHFGIGFSYDYYEAKQYFLDDSTKSYIDFKANVYGGRIFTRYYLRILFDNFLGNFFVHGEYEYLYYTRPYKEDPKGNIIDPYNYTYSKGKDVQEISSLFIGVGYEQSISPRAFIDILILYNLNETYNSPYANPVFRIGFGYRL